MLLSYIASCPPFFFLLTRFLLLTLFKIFILPLDKSNYYSGILLTLAIKRQHIFCNNVKGHCYALKATLESYTELTAKL